MGGAHGWNGAKKEAIRRFQEFLAGVGITACFDAGTLSFGEKTYEYYRTAMSEMAQAGELKCRVRSSFWLQPYDYDDWDTCREYLGGIMSTAQTELLCIH